MSRVARTLAVIATLAAAGCARHAATPSVARAGNTGSAIALMEDLTVERTIRAAALSALAHPDAPRASAVLSQLARRTTSTLAVPQVATRCPAVATHAAALSPAHAATLRALRRATLVIGVLYTCGACQEWHLSLGTGALLGDQGLAVTNLHVLQRPGAAVFVAMTADGRVHGVSAGIAANTHRDVALVRLSPGKGARPMRGLALGTDPAQGTPVWLMSHPNRRFYFLSHGHVARTYLAGTPPAPMVEISAAFARGSSGGPVVDRCGRLVGLATNTRSVYYRDKPPRDLQMVLRRAVPVSAVRALFGPNERVAHSASAASSR